MPFLLRMSIEILPLTLLLWQFWLAAVVIAYVTVRARSRSADAPALTRWRWIAELISLAAIPLAMLAIGVGFWEVDPEGRIYGPVLTTLGLLNLAAASALTWRHRARALATGAISLAALFWTAGCLFVGSMAITGDWL